MAPELRAEVRRRRRTKQSFEDEASGQGQLFHAAKPFLWFSGLRDEFKVADVLADGAVELMAEKSSRQRGAPHAASPRPGL
jgi:hypothetical protein